MAAAAVDKGRTKMHLSDNIITAARSLGRTLRKDADIQAYLAALERLEADQEAQELEGRLYDLFDQLTTRQQAGEQLSRTEIEAFYALRSQVRANPHISERDAVLQALKPFLADIVEVISSRIGADYTALVTARDP
jgi:cell fate (sporulation/competence/biofilm development) regulator YlbF (YheA/YmcA/DUF963 family)